MVPTRYHAWKEPLAKNRPVDRTVGPNTAKTAHPIVVRPTSLTAGRRVTTFRQARGPCPR